MRDKNRLPVFYNELMRIHMDNFPDWRFGQLISNFVCWLQVNKNINDIFYIEEDAALKYINEFTRQIKEGL